MIHDLTSKQQQAVAYTDGPLLIVAGPGTGKTRVLIEKAIYLVNEREIGPNKILVCTFTIKAANELKERLRQRLGDSVENMQISTIHSFCKKMLETFPAHINFGNIFEVMDELDQFIFVNKNFWNFGLAKFHQEVDVSSLINFYNKATENNVDEEKLIEKLCGSDISEFEMAIAKSYKYYLSTLLNPDNPRVDFALLQREFYRLIKKNHDVLDEVRSMFDYILIDEYQDTNPIQDAIFRLISEPSYKVTAVGDEDQSIYGFRGASLENFRSFLQRYPHAEKMLLNENFRSSAQIVKTFDRFMKPHRTFTKGIVAMKDEFSAPILLESDTLQEEGENLAKFIRKLNKENNVDFADIAILFKSVRGHSQHIVEALEEKNIPYVVYGDSALLKENVVLDMLILLGLVNNYKFGDYDKKKLFRYNIIESRLLNLESQSIDKLKKGLDQYRLLEQVSNPKLSRWEIDEKNKKKLLKLKNYKRSVQRNEPSLLRQFYKLLDITGFHAKLFDQFNDQKELSLRLLAKLSNIINKFEANTGSHKFKSFLNHILNIPENKMEDTPQLDDKDVVKLMTIHQAKGLEFPVVIMGGITKRRYYTNEKDDENLLGIPKELMLNQSEFDQVAELRRSFYVGMSRAQRILVFSVIGKNRDNRSKYLNNIDNLQNPQAFNKNLDIHYEAPKEKTRLSFSSINIYLGCPFRFYLRSLIDFATPLEFFQSYGIIVHNCLRKMHLLIKEGEELNMAKMVEIVDMYCKDSVCIKKYRNELISDLWKYYMNSENFIEEVVDVELPYSYIDSDIVTTGKADLVIKDEEEDYILVDFKSRYKSGLEKLNVDTQLRMYNIALNNRYDKPIKKICAYTFKDNEKTFFNNSEQDLQATKGLISEVSEAIESKQFERKWNSNFCESQAGKCDFYYLCQRLEGEYEN